MTSKLWNDYRGYDTTLDAFENTMRDLELEYLDLYLIHWPEPKGRTKDWKNVNAQTWLAMEKLL